MREQVIYLYPDYAPEIYSDEYENFFCRISGEKIKKQQSNGCLFIRYNESRYGLASLRKHAVRSVKVIEDYHF